MSTTTKQFPTLLIIYGSQKGQAQAIAEELLETARQEFSLEADLYCLSHPDIIGTIKRVGFAVFVVSTTGEGEPPDTVRKFWRFIKDKELPSDFFTGLNFALLGLGDSNYANFCAMGKNLNQRLLNLGANAFYEAGFADDGTGLEVVVDPWVDNIWSAFKAFVSVMYKKKQPNESSPLLPEAASDCSVTNSSQSAATRFPLLPNPTSNSTRQAHSAENLIPPTLISPVKRNEYILGKNGFVADSFTPTIEEESAPKLGEISLTSSASDPSLHIHRRNIQNARNTDMDIISNRISSNLKLTYPDFIGEGNALILPNFNGKDGSKLQRESRLPLLPVPSNSRDNLASHSSTPDLISEKRKIYTASAPSAPAVSLSGYDHLTTPSLPPEYIGLEILNAMRTCPAYRTERIYPHDTISACEIVAARQLTDTQQYTDVNCVIELEIQMEELFGFQPGDAVGILAPNDELEVEYLLDRLDLRESADCIIKLSILPFNTKNGAVIPPYIPQNCTVRELLLHHLDIRGMPKKSLLWVLAQYTADKEERLRLAKLASKEGAGEYSQLIREQSATLMDVLYLFPSCKPPLSRLIEILLPLCPRYYSICSSPLKSENRIKIAFSLVKLDNREWHPSNRFGICTSWLNTLAKQFIGGHKEKIQLSILARMINPFHLPEDATRPIILVGPGTGVAPFIGFLEHRERLKLDQGKEIGKSILFFGCRHENGDFLFKDELNSFTTHNILTDLHVSFSRDEGYPYRYVQHRMAEHGKELLRLIREENAIFYLCGDAKDMAPDVRTAWIEISEKFGGMTRDDATVFIKELQKGKQYLQDIWA